MNKKKRVLLTGYGAFDVHSENPSERLCEVMKDGDYGFQLETKILPVVFSRIPDVLADLDLSSYDIVVFCGLAASREEVTPEKIALNWLYSPDRSDNEGVKVDRGEALIPELPLAQMSSFPVEALTAFLNDHGTKAKMSFSAGTYVCNATYFYGLSFSLGRNQCVFIHLPKDCDVVKLAKNLSDFIATL